MSMTTQTRTIKISIGINDAFRGTLRCGTTSDIPLRLSSVRITPLTDLKRGFGRTTSLEPMPKKDASELDLATLHILLTTMKSALLLSDSEDRQYVFQSCTFSTATLATYGAVTHKSSRLAKAVLSETQTQDDLLLDNATTNKQPRKEKLVMDKLTWFNILENNKNDEPPPDLQQASETCVDCNNPTPQHLVTQMVPSVILGSTYVVEKTQLKEVVSYLWMTLAAIKDRVRNPNRDNVKVLRVIQIQTLLRLQLLAMDKKTFLKLYSKKLIDRKRKKGGSNNGDLIPEVISILEHASFLLVMNKTLVQFLEEIIPTSIYCSIPDQIQELFDFFECDNPFLDQDDEDDEDSHFSSVFESHQTQHKSSPTAPSPTTVPKKKKAKIGNEKSVKFEHEDLTLQSMKLTARRSNPLIKDAKAKYVGSHFNTKLANISAHYHEVQAAAVVVQKQQKQPTARRKSKIPSKTKYVSTRKSTTSPVKQKQRKGVVRETPSKYCSPLAGKGRVSTFDMFSIADSAKMNLSFVGETPVKKPGKENRVLPFLLSSRKPFTLSKANSSSTTTRLLQQQPVESKTLSSTRLMAQQALAAARRGKR